MANCSAVMFGGYQSTLYYMTLLAQDVNHLSAGETSVRLLPMGVISFLVCLLMWWMLEVYDSKYLLLGGMAICTIAPIPSAIMQTDQTNFWEHIFSSAVMTSVGFTILFCTITVALLASVPANIKSLCGGMIQSAFQVSVSDSRRRTAARLTLIFPDRWWCGASHYQCDRAVDRDE